MMQEAFAGYNNNGETKSHIGDQIKLIKGNKDFATQFFDKLKAQNIFKNINAEHDVQIHQVKGLKCIKDSRDNKGLFSSFCLYAAK
jgi:predicted phosphodiesterase